MINRLYTLVFLLMMLVTIPASAATISPNDPTARSELEGLSPQDKRLLTAPLISFSPFSATNNTVVPGVADPLGTGVDPQLRVFGGTVQFMDLLGNFTAADNGKAADLELPPGALNGVNLLDNFIAVYLSYNGRAFDKSVWSLPGAEVMDRNGLPVTSETSPLTLAGYGKVAENLQPYLKTWNHCSGREKRHRIMVQSVKRGAWACSVPAVCECYSS
jgi:hypothetical protein